MRFPITRHWRHVAVVVDRGLRGDWYFKVLGGTRKPPFNKGAGYIGGFTFFVCWRCVDHLSMYVPRRRLQIGVTRNANRVPWTRS